jgi:hypothetical protein
VLPRAGLVHKGERDRQCSHCPGLQWHPARVISSHPRSITSAEPARLGPPARLACTGAGHSDVTQLRLGLWMTSEALGQPRIFADRAWQEWRWPGCQDPCGQPLALTGIMAYLNLFRIRSSTSALLVRRDFAGRNKALRKLLAMPVNPVNDAGDSPLRRGAARHQADVAGRQPDLFDVGRPD